MRRLALASMCAALTMPLTAQAQDRAAEKPAPAPLEASIPAGGMAFVDMLAAEFYEQTLRLSQSSRIQMTTAVYYRELTAGERAGFIHQRREFWRALNEDQRRVFRQSKTPLFMHLTEAQKRPFRLIAIEKLSADQAEMSAVAGSAHQKEI